MFQYDLIIKQIKRKFQFSPPPDLYLCLLATSVSVHRDTTVLLLPALTFYMKFAFDNVRE